MTTKSTSPDRRGSFSGITALAIGILTPVAVFGYTAAGDRNFPATLILQQVGPSDALWLPFSTNPMEAAKNGDTTRQTDFIGTFSKTITDQLGVMVEDGPILRDRLHAHSVAGFENLTVTIQDEMVLDQQHEFVFSAGVMQEIGGTGTARVGPPAQRQSATQPFATFAKGFGDLPIGYLRPLAVTGFAGYQFGYGQRGDIVNAGFSLQYSLPYLVSKVADAGLPALLRGMTPIVEVMYSAPSAGSKQQETLVVAPGVSYSQGSGWELAVEAMIPTNKATGSGIGFIVQGLIQFDYLLPDSVLGRPIFSSH